MEPGYSKADSSNLPVVDTFMIHTFYHNNPQFVSAEIRNVKTQRSTRDEYGDDAICYVQLKREQDICTVRAKITPEHRVHSKAYAVTVLLNESEEKIISCGCKHSVAVLFWLYRRSEEPSVTSVECYWRTSKLAKVGRTLKSMSIKDMYNGPELGPKGGHFLTEVVSKGSESLLHSCFKDGDCVTKISMHHLILNYLKNKEEEDNLPDADEFIQYCKDSIEEDDCLTIDISTTLQSKTPRWYEARYGRITASKLHEAAHCKTFDGTLVETIFGANRVPETDAVSRGRDLEDAVLEVVANRCKIVVSKTGLVLSKDFPLFGASPDAVSEKYCIEIKCPSKEKTVASYLTADGKICKKPFTQLQLQMFLTKKKFGLFCVASPSFEENKDVTIIETELDEEFCENTMSAAEIFWKSAIFPKLCKV